MLFLQTESDFLCRPYKIKGRRRKEVHCLFWGGQGQGWCVGCYLFYIYILYQVVLLLIYFIYYLLQNKLFTQILRLRNWRIYLYAFNKHYARTTCFVEYWLLVYISCTEVISTMYFASHKPLCRPNDEKICTQRIDSGEFEATGFSPKIDGYYMRCVINVGL